MSTEFGQGADAVVSENGGTTATSGGAGTADTLSAGWFGGAGAVNQAIVLKFDLSHVAPGSITDATLQLTSVDGIAGNRRFDVFGLEHESLYL